MDTRDDVTDDDVGIGGCQIDMVAIFLFGKCQPVIAKKIFYPSD